MATQLEQLSEKFRKEHLTRNSYDSKNLYNSNNRNAQSDGDEKGNERGKGENNGQIGSLSDINKRTELIASNKFGEKKRYPDF